MRAIGWTVVVALAGCGGGLSDADTKSLQDSVRATVDALELCAPPATSCEAAQVRGDMRGVRCSDGSILKRHDKPVPAGALDGCPPR